MMPSIWDQIRVKIQYRYNDGHMCNKALLLLFNWMVERHIDGYRIDWQVSKQRVDVAIYLAVKTGSKFLHEFEFCKF